MLIRCPWRGNVRELRNVAEFLVSKGKKYIEAEDLPPLRSEYRAGDIETPDREKSTVIDRFILQEGRDIELYFEVLRALSERYGRQKLTGRINERGYLYTEGEVRKALFKLSSYGFIRSPKGRGGSVITGEGVDLLETVEGFKRRGILR